ncbi:C2C2 zinc finger domain-containing protein [Cryptosporidium felis]|nr:C2C2 zinc finger domain-containing protein [Cryptosporidium felis]
MLSDQKKAFDCSSSCISRLLNKSNKAQSLEEIQDCIQKCQLPIETFQNEVNAELNRINDSIINCQQSCFNMFEHLFKKPEELLKVLNENHELIKCYKQCFTDNHSTFLKIKENLIRKN